MKSKLLLRLAALLAVLTVSITANAQVWIGTQLGTPARQGSVTTNVDNSLSIQGGGGDIWGNSDGGYYYYTWVQGDFDLKIHVQDFTTSLYYETNYNSWEWGKVEAMVRWTDPANGVQGNDAFIASMLAPGQGNGNGAQYRPARAAGAANAGSADTTDTLPEWIRLTRTNNTFTVLSSIDEGATWVLHQTIDTTSTANGFGTAWPSTLTVGLAITAHNDNADIYATALINPPTLNVAGATWTPPTAASISQDVTDCNTFAGGEASFKFVAANNAGLVPLPMAYQWYKDGTLLTGVTRNTYTFLATAGDAGAQIKCVAWPTIYPSITVTSSTATVALTVSSVVYSNAVKMEVFARANRNDLEIGNTGTGDTGNASRGVLPGKLQWLSTVDDAGGFGDNTSRRVSGWFIPWTTGNYTFYAACDDDSDVFLSTDATPVNKTLICQEPVWSGQENWTNAGGGGDAAINQKCSKTWTNALGEAPFAAGIPLTAGNLYYFEVVEHNGGGGDNVGLTATMVDDLPPTNGTPSVLTGNNIAVVTWVPTMNWVVQPTNFIAVVGAAPILYAPVTTTSEMAPHYQWYRAGAAVAGQTRSDYSIGQVLADMSGQQFYCVASVPGLTMTSSVATMTVQTGVFEPGFVLNQRWAGVENRQGAADNLLGTPTYQAAIPSLEAAVDNPNVGDMAHYTRKISGLFVPPTSGRYVFFTCSDDASDLYISTDATAISKYMIAQETGWSNPWNWTGVGDLAAANNTASILPQKRSDQWTNATSANLAPYASGIQLTAGNQYYIEVDTQQGTGGGNVEVNYKLTTDADPPNGNGTFSTAADSKLTGTAIGMNAPKSQWVNFTLQPTNTTVPAGERSAATFYAQGATDSQIPVGSIRSTGGTAPTEVANQFVFFQWYKNNVLIPGATTSSYTQTGIRASDNNTTFLCQMRSLGYGTPPNNRQWSNSAPAVLTVATDPTVPTITYSGYYLGTEPFAPTNWISVTFSVPMDPNSLTNPANYSVSGGLSVWGVQVSADGRHVQIAVDAAPTGTPTVTITGARTWSDVALVANTAQSHALPSNLTFLDIGQDDQNTGALDPEIPSRLYIDGTNSFTIAAVGSDIWDTHDGFNFLYEQKTGDFDVVLRQTSYSPVDRWAKAGLMVREVIDPRNGSGGTPAQSRNWNIVNDPPAVPCLRDGNGVNEVECNWRTNTALNDQSHSWITNTAPAPAYPNAWVRIKRVGQTLTAYSGSNGATWTPLAYMDCASRTDTPQLPNALYVGICVTGHLPINTVPDPETYLNVVSVDNYTSSYVAPPPQQTLSVQRSGGNVIVSWTPGGGGTLQSSTDLVNWTDVGTANPSAPIPATGAQMFFKVRP